MYSWMRIQTSMWAGGERKEREEMITIDVFALP